MLVENQLNYLFLYVKKHKQNHSLLLFSSLMMFGKILGNPFYYTLLASREYQRQCAPPLAV